ncbi:exported hypothetical protein [Cupriavidus taiwanensis]|nr:exported hypothetical protein [Cupriavidus taiwanensis]
MLLTSSRRRRQTPLLFWKSYIGAWRRLSIFRSVCQVCAVSGLLLAGCGAIVSGTTSTANSLDQAATRERITKLRAEQIEQIRSLQAQGDPMGDYLFALANAEGWIGEHRISDPVAIRDLYQKAADNGSSDAMIALGLMLFDGRGAPQYTKGVYLPREQQDMKRGLEWLERGMKSRCSYAQPLYNAMASVNKQCLVFRSPARWVWPAFRDGRTRRNLDGSFTYVLKPDAERERYWREKNAACEASAEVRTTAKDCSY